MTGVDRVRNEVTESRVRVTESMSDRVVRKYLKILEPLVTNMHDVDGRSHKSTQCEVAGEKRCEIEVHV